MRAYVCTNEMHERLFRIREALGVSQREMARMMKYSDSYFGRLESHTDVNITERMAWHICSTFRVRYDYLVFGEEPMFKEYDMEMEQIAHRYEGMTETYKKFVRDFVEFAAQKSEMEGRSQGIAPG